jgi:hypothetical protein
MFNRLPSDFITGVLTGSKRTAWPTEDSWSSFVKEPIRLEGCFAPISVAREL